MLIKTFTEFTLFAWTATVEVVYDTAGKYFEHEFRSFTSPSKQIKGTLKYNVEDQEERILFEDLIEAFDESTAFTSHLESFESEFLEELRNNDAWDERE